MSGTSGSFIAHEVNQVDGYVQPITIGGLINIILATFAFSLSFVFVPIGIMFAMIFLIIKLDKSMAIKYFERLFINIALSLDVFGNYACSVLFNRVLIKSNTKAYRFGKEGETISSALGKNVIANNLTFLGKCLNSFLNFLDANHSIKSIKNNL